jgi:cell division protein FtsQ
VSATRRRILPRAVRRIRIPRPGVRTLATVLVLAAILVGIFFWVRQSSLVAVRQVTITGVSGPDASQIRSALTGAAEGMSTIHVDARRLHQAVAPFPVVRALHLAGHFPHGLAITVTEEIPVAVIVDGGQRTLVAADGAVLGAARSGTSVPTIAAPVASGATHVTGIAREEVGLLAAAPYPLISRMASVAVTPGSGLAAALRDGPTIVFGTDTELAAKWRSAIAVLAAPSSAGASYIDVTAPSRPAAGAGTDTTSTSTTG